MERDSILYEIRRKRQIIAYYFLPDETMAKLYSRVILKKNVDLKNPQTFNEKIQWLKIHEFSNNPLVIKGADKYALREYTKRKGLGSTLVPLIGAWEKEEDIDWDSLPDKFVLKCNHRCPNNILCADQSKFDCNAAGQQLSAWMKEDFGAYNNELHYCRIKPHMITCEEYHEEKIIDYQSFCFNGEPKYIYVLRDFVHDRQAHIGFFYLDGKKMPLIRDNYAPVDIDELPPFFDSMKKDATILCRDFPFLQVDFFLANNTYYFAELTFTPSTGMVPFNSDKYDLEWGKMLNIENLVTNVGGVLLLVEFSAAQSDTTYEERWCA